MVVRYIWIGMERRRLKAGKMKSMMINQPLKHKQRNHSTKKNHYQVKQSNKYKIKTRTHKINNRIKLLQKIKQMKWKAKETCLNFRNKINKQ
jgi:putative IMPACT (imprinted ancient) family translation regulator